MHVPPPPAVSRPECRLACFMRHVEGARHAGAGARLREDDGPAAAVQVGRHARQQLAPPAVDVRQIVRVCGAQAHRPPARHLRCGRSNQFSFRRRACAPWWRKVRSPLWHPGFVHRRHQVRVGPGAAGTASSVYAVRHTPSGAARQRSASPPYMPARCVQAHPGLPGAAGHARAAAGPARQGRALDEASHQGKPPKSHCRADHRSAGSARPLVRHRQHHACEHFVVRAARRAADLGIVQHVALLAELAMHARQQKCTRESRLLHSSPS
jgi:hypothetical protein